MDINRLFKNTSLTEWMFFLTVILLLLSGLLVYYSLTVSEGALVGIWSQVLQIVVGLLLFGWISRIDYRIFRNIGTWFYVAAIILLLVVLLVGDVEYGARRWVDLGLIKFQPVEIVKVFFTIYLAGYFAKKGDNLSIRDFFRSMLAMAFPVFLIMMQPDLGSALVLVVIWLAMVFVSPLPRRYIFWLFGLAFVTLPFSWFFLHDYQKNRLLTFLDPTRDPYGMGYNVLQSQIAIGSGGWFGLGLGKGWQSQLQFLPVAYSDFAFAVLGEEFGFVGALLVIFCYGYLIWYAWSIAYQTVDRFGFYIAVGIGAFLFFQVFVNIGMNIGIMPVTGIPLPLISSGGTSMMMSMIVLGAVLSIRNKSART